MARTPKVGGPLRETLLRERLRSTKIDGIVNTLKVAREAAGMSQMKLARLAGITPSALSQIESGDVQPSLATLRRLARALGLSLELVERKGVV